MKYQIVESIEAGFFARVEPPMTFSIPQPDMTREFDISDHVFVVATQIDGIPRTVIHAARRLEDGWSYGSCGSRVVDGIADGPRAMAIQGATPEAA